MSNIGQAALIVVGTVVGAYFGAPQLGFALGAIAGSVLFPTQLPAGPQMKDGRTTTANIGTPVPIVFGTASVAGQVIWLAPYVTNTTEQGAKGGPEQEQYSYTQSIAIALCESPIDGQTAIGGITRIWENGTIVYDIRPIQPADTALGYAAETEQEYENRLTASAAYAETFTLYLGSEDQEPDPTIEATQGIGNVPGFRGLAYIVYPNRALQTAQGWRHPNFTFEVFQHGTGNCTDTSATSNWVLYDWADNTTEVDPRDPRGYYGNYCAFFNNGGGGEAYISGGSYHDNPDDALADAAPFGGMYPKLLGWNSGGNGIFPWNTVAQGAIVTPAEMRGYLYYNIHEAGSQTGHFITQAEWAGFGMCEYGGANDITGSQFWWTGGYIFDGGFQYYGHGVFGKFLYNDGATAPPSLGPTVPFNVSTVGGCDSDENYAVGFIPDSWLYFTRKLSPPSPICYNRPAAPLAGYCINEDGLYQKEAPWVLDPAHENYLVLANLFVSGDQVVQYPLNPCLLNSSPNNTEAFWTAAYNEAVTAGTMPSGYTYGVNYPATAAGPDDGGPWGGGGAWIVDSEVCTGSGGPASLDQVILALCLRAGLSADQIDVTDMASISCNGYAIDSISNASDCISPLRSIGFFDAIESGSVLRFQARGKPIVATLTTDQIGAYDGSSTGDVPPSVSVKRTQDVDLPRQIRLHYKAVSRDYQDNEQDSPFRLVSKAVNDQDMELPMCLVDTQALQAAQVIWADAWAGRNEYTVSVDQSLSALEVGDPIAIPDNGITQRVRITADTVSSGVLRKLTCVSDDEAAYVSVAVAAEPYSGTTRMVIIQQTAYVLMDLPALQDSDSNAGFYVAAWPVTGGGNTWKGAQFYSSIDGGHTWTSQFGVSSATDNGLLDEGVPASQAFTWDDDTVIRVSATGASSFESRTDDAVLAGANAAAMGADGRWEIVQFANATQISATTWALSRLLRGRRGTEHNMGSSVAGDMFVMISEGTLGRFLLQNTQIGAALTYDGVSIGASFGTGVESTFTAEGMALTPFSPVDVTLVLESGGDMLISWTRRDRLNGTLMSDADMPLSDPPLTFSIDILADSPPAVVRTLTSNTTSVTYTAAEMNSDGVNPARLPSDYRYLLDQFGQVAVGGPAPYWFNNGTNWYAFENQGNADMRVFDEAFDPVTGGGSLASATSYFVKAIKVSDTLIYLSIIIDGGGTVQTYVFDLTTGDLPADNYVGVGDVCVTPSGTVYFVAKGPAGNLLPLDATTLAPGSGVSVAGSTTVGKIAADNTYVYAIEGSALQNVLRINPSTGAVSTVLANVPGASQFLWDIAFNQGYLYLAYGSASGSVTVRRYVVSTWLIDPDFTPPSFPIPNAGNPMVEGHCFFFDGAYMSVGPPGNLADGACPTAYVVDLSVSNAPRIFTAESGDAIAANVYQISQVVGRGFPGYGTYTGD